ncbi:MAG: hypothetical protein QM708_00725 [Propioniciclava sp.]|uniref:hypothetical protein n=1 Tax=Propioniciclava sp. TaxID=2038686 RepID=UPI0039E634BD
MADSTRRDERGTALSAMIAVLVVSLFAVVGLVVDGGAQSAARARAASGAVEAARAAVDAGATARASGAAPNVLAMVGEGRRALAERGLDGEVSVEAGVVHVHARTSAKTVFLSLIGIGELAASGEAAAALEDS